MRRNALRVSASVLLTIVVVGCGKKADPMDQTAYGGTDPYAAPAASAYQQDTFPTYGSPTPIEPAYSAPVGTTASADASGQRMHTVVKKDTLFGLARQYYGDASRWKDIYEANRTRISDPNRIRVGDKLVIP